MKKSLGKNIDNLFQDEGDSVRVLKKNAHQEVVRNIALERICASAHQPRKNFFDHSIEELALSIRENGIIQPLIVRPHPTKGFELIAGERRYRAAQVAGLKEVPVIVRDWSDKEASVAALVENIQREDLDPVERALAFAELVEAYKWKQQELASKLGLSRSQVANTLRFLKLDPVVLEHLQQRYITEGHAKVLAGLSLEKQRRFSTLCIQKDWSVRHLEMAIEREKSRSALEEESGDPVWESEREFFYNKMREKIEESLLTKVEFREKKQGQGQIIFHYHSDDQLIDLLNQLSLGDVLSSI